MAKFLRTNGISYKIEDIIVDAKEELVIISPYLKISNNLFERLKEKSDEGVRIDFVYGKSELSPAERRKIDGLRTINLYYYDNLHAKCYYNEQEMIITSMNLYEFSEKNNREMGVLITKSEDARIFEDGVQEAKSIIAASQKIAGQQDQQDRQEKQEGLATVATIVSFPINMLSSTPELDRLLHLGTVSELLISRLKKEYPQQKFTIGNVKGEVHCESFLAEHIELRITPGSQSWRIDIRLQHSDWRIKKELWDMLSVTFKRSIEGSVPPGILNWGGQMKRVKLDVYQPKYPDFFTTNRSSIENTLILLKAAELEIIARVADYAKTHQL